MRCNYRLYILLTFVIAGHLIAYFDSNQAIASQSTDESPVLTGPVRVYDGDSIFFGRIEVRLDAIDAPERDQACFDKAHKFWPCGVVARDALRKMVGDNYVHCVLSGKDKYRRLLGVCYVGKKDLNAAMVKKGYAVSYHYFSDKYASQESEAKHAQRGIWQDMAFTEPYYCRHFEAGHTCYEFDYSSGTGRVAPTPLIGKSHAVNAPE